MAGFLRHPVEDALVLQAGGQVLVVIVVRNADEILVTVFAGVVSDIVVGDVVRHHDGPFDGTHQGIQLTGRIAQGVQAAHQTAHAGSGDHVHRDTQFFHIPDDAQVRQASGTAAGQDQPHGGPVPADRVHPGADPGERGGILLGMGAAENLGSGARGKGRKGEDKGDQSFHSFEVYLSSKFQIYEKYSYI